jgi:hypothetical protein
MRLKQGIKPPEEREASFVMRDIYDSPMWFEHVVWGGEREVKNMIHPHRYTEQSNFGSENDGRNIVLSLNIDGVSPFDSVANSYTPMQCIVLNAPPDKRHKVPFMLLPGFIPGPDKPKHLSPYLTVLVEELQRLYDVGFQAVDPFDYRTRTYRVKLLSTNCDLLAHNANNMQQGHAATFGCIKCEVQVCYFLSWCYRCNVCITNRD